MNYFDKKKDKQLKAPLILIPVSLSRTSTQSPFTLTKHVSDSKFNITLIESLKNDYDIEIEELEKKLPKDECGLDVEKIFSIVSEKVKSFEDPTRWFVDEKDCFLSLFSFKKILMYKGADSKKEAQKIHDSLNNLLIKQSA